MKLDTVEELLPQQEWEVAALIAHDVVEIFTVAEMTAASVVSYLREAVEHESASLPLVKYVREFVAADDPTRVLQPPV